MAAELRILLLEDDAADAELAERELRKSGMAFSSRRVDGREAFVAALEGYCPDVILADYNLPAFDGLTALSIVREKAPQVPFIFVSGAMGEEFAIETLRRGAADYVLKGRLAKLVPAVDRALQEVAERRRRRQAEESLRESEERFRTVADYAGDWEYWEGPQCEVLYMSPSCEGITGYTRDEFAADPGLLNRIVHPNDAESWVAHRHDVCDNMASAQLDFRIVRRDGDIRWIAHHCAAVRGKAGQYKGRRANNRDITDRKRMEDELRKMATTDDLTGLPNRRHFLDRLDEQLARVQRLVTSSAAILMLDLDHFKHINDIYGHAAGDAVLAHFGAILRGELRKIDMAGRMGGEEFAVVLPGADATAALAFAERVCRKVAASPPVLDGRPIPVTVSIGIAAINATDTSTDAAIMRADAALYRAKADGRNRVRVAA